MSPNVDGDRDEPGMPSIDDGTLSDLRSINGLLNGEDPETGDLETALRWRAVYAELLRFKDRMLRTAEDAHEAVPTEGEDAVGEDLAILRAERSHLRARLDFWTRRSHELGGE